MKSKVTQKDILFIFISSFVVTAAWIGFNLYHTWVTTTITPDLQMKIQPIEPNFDMTTLESLKTRKQVPPTYQIAGGAQPTPTASASGQTIQQQLPTTPATNQTTDIALPTGIQGQ